MGRDNCISVNGCSISCKILNPWVSKARESESLRLSTQRKIWRRLTPYGPITRIGKPPAYFILSGFFPLSTVQAVPLHRAHTDPSGLQLQWSWAPGQAGPGLTQTSSFETCCSQAQPWEWNKRHSREASVCCCWWNEVLLPTETLPVLCCSNTIITPPSAVLCAWLSPGAAFPAASDLALPHNPQELLQPDISSPYRTGQNYKNITAFPTLEQRQGLEGRDAPTYFPNRLFSHFPISHSKFHKYLQGQNPVLRSWSSDLDMWQSIQSPFFGRNCLQYNLLLIQSSVSLKQNLPEPTISNLFFLLPSLLYFISCVVPASSLRGVSLGKIMSLIFFTLCT